MLSKIAVLTLLITLFSCGTNRALSLEQTNQYLSQKDGLKQVVDSFAQKNILDNKVAGMAVAVIGPKGIKYFTYGYSDQEKKRLMTTDSIFQIGSISKVFTSSLLAILEDEKYLDMKGPFCKLMKSNFNPNAQWLKEVSLISLASHSSGLPAEYRNIKMLKNVIHFLWTGKNIWIDLEEREMWEFIQNYDFDNSHKNQFKYSNVGYVLLGGLLSNVIPGKNFDTLIKEKITDPLLLLDTSFDLTHEQKTRLVTGYSGNAPPFMKRGIAMAPWEFNNGLRAAGGLYSTVKDLAIFLNATINNSKSAIGNSLEKTHEKILKFKKGFVGLGWFIENLPESGYEQVYANGIISGYTSYMGFNPQTKVGVVVLQNTMNMNYEFGEYFLDHLLQAENNLSRPLQ